ncbi:MAG: V-type ATP synthase subunit F [Candidatus Fimenecus sp.]
MYKTVVIGDRDSIYGFKSLGLDIIPVNEKKEAYEVVKKAAANGTYAVIFVTEKVFSEIKDISEHYKEQPYPVIIPIPGVSGNTGEGSKNVTDCIKRAVGSDIVG